MKKVEKKILPEYFQAIMDGRKTFEWRLNDFKIAEGDTLILREWNPETKDYTGRQLEKEVGYIGTWKIQDLEKFHPLNEIEEKGFHIISLK